MGRKFDKGKQVCEHQSELSVFIHHHHHHIDIEIEKGQRGEYSNLLTACIKDFLERTNITFISLAVFISLSLFLNKLLFFGSWVEMDKRSCALVAKSEQTVKKPLRKQFHRWLQFPGLSQESLEQKVTDCQQLTVEQTNCQKTICKKNGARKRFTVGNLSK